MPAVVVRSGLGLGDRPARSPPARCRGWYRLSIRIGTAAEGASEQRRASDEHVEVARRLEPWLPSGHDLLGFDVLRPVVGGGRLSPIFERPPLRYRHPIGVSRAQRQRALDQTGHEPRGLVHSVVAERCLSISVAPGSGTPHHRCTLAPWLAQRSECSTYLVDEQLW